MKKKIDEYLDKLYKLERVSLKYNLDNITDICSELDNPQNNFTSIHIAGTNGKGATASFMASILQEYGLRTGLFTSPHILNFNERIRINGRKIPDKYIINFVDKYYYLFNKYKPSFFEINTAMAFKYFSERKVDVAVIEAGLGGRLDSTNILKPELSVITEIGIDHTEYLGKDLKSIAHEKAGIIKKNIPVVITDRHKELKEIFIKRSSDKYISFASDNISVKNVSLKDYKTKFDLELIFNNEKILLRECIIPLIGDYQIYNAGASVYAVLLYLLINKIKPSGTIIKRGLKNLKINTAYRGRLDNFKIKNKNYILDITHNKDGISEMIKNLRNMNIKPFIIYGCSSDKDYKSIIKILSEISDTLIFSRMSYEKVADPIEMFKYAKSLNNDKNYYYTCCMKDSLRIENILNSENLPVLITGSFFNVYDAIKELNLVSYFE